MSKVLHFNGHGETGEDATLRALTSKDPVERIMGRGASSVWMERLQAWVNDEISRPKAKSADVIYALARLQVQIFASIVGQVGHAKGDPVITELMATLVKLEMPEHLIRVRQQMGQP